MKLQCERAEGGPALASDHGPVLHRLLAGCDPGPTVAPQPPGEVVVVVSAQAAQAARDAAQPQEQQDWWQQAQGLSPAGPLVAVNKSGVKPQMLSLPEGKGSVRGMGLTFKTNLRTGSASLSLPISLPPARRGVGPRLSFDYSSGGSQGVAGLGWGFEVGFVARQTDKGLPRYLDDVDRFIYNGGRELVRVSPTTGEVIPAVYGGAEAMERYYRAWISGEQERAMAT